MDLAGPLVSLQNHLRETVEQRTPGLLVPLLTIRIAIADADQRAVSRDLESEMVVGRWHRAAFLVESFDLENRYILSVRIDLRTVGGKLDCNGWTCRLTLLCEHNLSILTAARFYRAGLVLNLPL